MSIVNNALAFPNCEAPGAAAPDIKPVQDGTASCDTGPGFAKELKDCESKIPSQTQETGPQKTGPQKAKPQEEEKGDAEEKDNGMPNDSGPTAAIYGIVGILEGFEPPGYQSDDTACIGEGSIAPLSQQTAVQNVSAGEAPPLPESAAKNSAEQTPESKTPANGAATSELPEQIARMLQNSETGTKPVQTQDEILNIVGEYLDSLENTNSEAQGTAPKVQTSGMNANGAVNAGNTAAPAVTAKTGGTVNAPDTVNVKASADVQTDVKPGDARTPQAAAPKASEAAKPEAAAPKAVQARPETAEPQAAESKPLETEKPAAREQPINLGAANVAQTTAYKAEEEQAVPFKAEAKPETVRESVLKIVDKVKTEASEGRYDFDIDLKPDFMGKVSIKLTMEDGSVKVQIKAEDAAVKGMLSDQMPSLHNMLKDKGIPVTTIDLSYGGDTMSGRGESAGQYERRNPQGNSFYEQASDGTFESAKEKYDFYLGGSNIEYLA